MLKSLFSYFLTLSITFGYSQNKPEILSQWVGKYTQQDYLKNEIVAVTAVAIAAKAPILAWVISDTDSLSVPRDVDAPNYQYFISLPEGFKISTISISEKSDIYLINSGSVGAVKGNNLKTNEAPCDEPPAMIMQNSWRVGLPSPDFSRIFHQVHHLIIHHSAGSNAATNYTQIVRDIYLYHTQVNGWSDIGYNYLISQDGTLYAGRDPGDGDQSSVMGAHFCSENRNTLGICVLGNYENASIPVTAFEKLKALLTYEVLKHDIDPEESRQHSTGLLATMAGHQDGCATLCPGINIYQQLADIRTEVGMTSRVCRGEKVLSFNFEPDIADVGEPIRLTNNSFGYEEFQWWVNDQLVPVENNEYTFDHPGIYNLGLIGFESDQTADTLILQEAVKITRSPKKPIVFPNPITGKTLNVDFLPQISLVSLWDFTGKLYLKQEPKSNEIRLPNEIPPGIYSLIIDTESGTFSEKVIIQ